MSTQNRILQLLATNTPNHLVAASCGVTDSYVSQLLADPAFAEQVAEARVQALTLVTERDNKYGDLEDKLLEKLETSVGMMFRPAEILAALKIVNAAVRRGAPQQAAVSNNARMVLLDLPPGVVARIQLSNQSEVVEVNGRSMATMSASHLMKEVATYEQERLPSPANTAAA